MVKIAPSLLAADFSALGRAVQQCSSAGAECLHFDVMDGLFVPNLAIGPQVLRDVRGLSSARFEAHLMIVQPERYVEDFVRAGADMIIVQVEACTHLQKTLSQIREAGALAGAALNPATPLGTLDYVLDDLDLLLIMTVNPGFGGQELLPAMLGKVAAARGLLERCGRDIDLEVDGGVTLSNARELACAGATVFVAGTTVFHHPEGAAAGVRELASAARAGACHE